MREGCVYVSSCALTNKFTPMEELAQPRWTAERAGWLLLTVKRTVKGSKSSTDQDACWPSHALLMYPLNKTLHSQLQDLLYFYIFPTIFKKVFREEQRTILIMLIL